MRIDEVRFYCSPGRSLWIHGRGRTGPDLTLITDDGTVVPGLIGTRAQALTDSAEQPGQAGEELYYEQVWRPEPIEDAGVAEGGWIVVGVAPLAVDIAARLAVRGGQVHRVAPVGNWWIDFTAGERGVIYVVDTDNAGDRACGLRTQPLELIQALREPTSLFLVTSGAQDLADEGLLDPFARQCGGWAA